jgi:hypothetical protein
MLRSRTIYRFDDPPPDACRKCVGLALEANPEIDDHADDLPGR